MKYIRTKDWHILEVGTTTDYGFVIMPECDKAVHFVNSGEEYVYVDVIQKANTIEELFDEIVVLEKGKTRPFVHDIHCRDLDRFIKESATIKGAIWTDKGLINVAKLNDKGEWELI